MTRVSIDTNVMGNMKRPSHKELSKKIRQAIAAVEDENFLLLNMLALVSDADELGYVIDDDIATLLIELLKKSHPDNYTGFRPPQKSYQQEIQGAELFAFVIENTSLDKPVYFKFSIVEEVLYLISLHYDRKK